jgi:putative ATP-dependent endonuclease of OLD family
VSVISVEGLNFDCFLPLFGESALRIPVAVLTDADPPGDTKKGSAAGDVADPGDTNEGSAAGDVADPPGDTNEGSTAGDVADPPGDTNEGSTAGDITLDVSYNTARMLQLQDRFIKVFHGVQTLEYDLALRAENRALMILALREMHPRMAVGLSNALGGQMSEDDKAKLLFNGMFKRRHNNVSKGRFAQTLAQVIVQSRAQFYVPDYIQQAIAHVASSPIPGSPSSTTAKS